MRSQISLTPMLIRYTQVVRGMVEKVFLTQPFVLFLTIIIHVQVFPALREDTRTKIKVIIYSYPDAYEAKVLLNSYLLKTAKYLGVYTLAISIRSYTTVQNRS